MSAPRLILEFEDLLLQAPASTELPRTAERCSNQVTNSFEEKIGRSIDRAVAFEFPIISYGPIKSVSVRQSDQMDDRLPNRTGLRATNALSMPRSFAIYW